MESNAMVVVLALAGLVVGATLLGLLLRAKQTRVRPASADDAAERIRPADLAPPIGETPGATLAAPEFGERLTLVQFSTETCARCPASARSLAGAADAIDGVRHVEIDVTHRDDLIRRFSVLRTPTVLVLDAQHRLRARVSGPVSAQRARELVEAHASAGRPTERNLA